MNNRTTLVFGALVVAVAAVLTGCTSVIGGHAVPASAGTSASTQAPIDVEPAGGCARSAEPATCVEWTQTAVDTGEKLAATAQTNPEAAAQMACSALSDTQWATYLGQDFYRYVENGTCTVSSQDNQLLVRTAVVPGKSWSDYFEAASKDPKAIAITTTFTINGKAVLRSAPKNTVDGLGQDLEDLTTGAGDEFKPWVLRVQIVLQQPRGKASTTPVDRTRLAFRDALVGDFLTRLFP
ncbi:hypothetical protein [Umezawaea sp. Da 62-37]|uniref:hypothetical protein n=1 Tax=Umezawaea sp. Da 62-37 TaxID=3075927 RepID=UPI0028F74890|nr:hypothetical protein [Umezawaea sp. Da 62-37]WNV85051.1 hypothetical protein RM788_44045 [Umezawaea sp. Da 62-37]